MGTDRHWPAWLLLGFFFTTGRSIFKLLFLHLVSFAWIFFFFPNKTTCHRNKAPALVALQLDFQLAVAGRSQACFRSAGSFLWAPQEMETLTWEQQRLGGGEVLCFLEKNVISSSLVLSLTCRRKALQAHRSRTSMDKTRTVCMKSVAVSWLFFFFPVFGKK